MSDNQSKFDLTTRVIHGGQSAEPHTGAVMPPIFTTSTYVQKSPGQHSGYEYSRTKNPTRYAFEKAMASVESGVQAFAFASGLAAISSITQLLQSGDHVIVMDDVYGGTFRLFDKVCQPHAQLRFDFTDLTDLDNLEKAYTENTRLIWIETPTNPTLKIVDIAAVVAWAKPRGIWVAVDNTLASPMLQRPLELGCDFVVHSTTKYIGGHSDMIGGVVITADEQLAERLAFIQNSVGAIAGPFDAYLALRGLKTLAVRMERHCSNAMTLARWLEKQQCVTKVYYPGLESHPQHACAIKQMAACGGMISFECEGSIDQAVAILERCKVFTLAESLGGVESLIEHPAIMTHGAIPIAQREALGIKDTLIRLSVGIESIDDLIHDLKQAFDGAFSCKVSTDHI